MAGGIYLTQLPVSQKELGTILQQSSSPSSCRDDDPVRSCISISSPPDALGALWCRSDLLDRSRSFRHLFADDSRRDDVRWRVKTTRNASVNVRFLTNLVRLPHQSSPVGGEMRWEGWRRVRDLRERERRDVRWNVEAWWGEIETMRLS